ncbi:MAG: glycosyltransferase, partial [Acidimicrobiales bacterium]
MTVLLVDWLGRGGVAQYSDAWVHELREAGHDVAVVTRPGRELAPTEPVAVARRGGKLAAHRHVVDAATHAIDALHPSTVVVQNFLIPAMEWKVHRAARRAGARTVFVVHDHRLHSRRAGVHFGLDRCVRAADVVVAHSHFVGDAAGAKAGRTDITVVPLGIPVGLLELPRPGSPPTIPGDGQLAVHFGALQRSYKGTATVVDLAGAGVAGWRFAIVGNGAPERVPGAQVIRGFVDGGTLVSAVASSQATLLPYSYATQSGAVALAQSLGSVVVST